MMEIAKLIESEIGDFFAGFGHPGEPETPEEMQSQLLARVMPLLSGLEQEPVAWTSQRSLDVRDKITAFTSKESAEEYGVKSKWEEITPLYAAPQLPPPAVVDEWRMMCGEWRDETVSIHDASGLIVSGISPNAAGIIIEAHNACRTAMLQGAEPVHDVDNTNRQFESLGCAEDTSRRFKCTGLIVTSDERKMEIPHCSKHPETELQVHPFEQIMSYPPQPVMYCPLCRPSVAKWVEFDNQLRQWKGVK